MEKEKDVKITFGAFDSELGEFEYTIPEGYEAEIKDGKVIVRKTESEDEIKINRIVACLENLDVEDNDILLKDIEWLKSLKNRVQPKQEWSEEDERMYQSALWHVKNSCGNQGKTSGEYAVYNWLKSLCLQKQWKPTEEQMLCLDSAIREYQLKGYPAKTLESLYEQLKTIKGE